MSLLTSLKIYHRCSIMDNGVYMHRMRYEYGVYMMLPTVRI